MISRNNRTGETTFHYLPERKVLKIMPRALIAHGDIVLDGVDKEILLERRGNIVFIQIGKEKLVLNAPTSLNLTEVLLTFVPLTEILKKLHEAPVDSVLKELEGLTYDEGLPHDVRKFVRLYAALIGLDHLDGAPENMKEYIILTVSRLTGKRVGEVAMHPEKVREKALEEIKDVLKKMQPADLFHVFNIVRAP